MPSTLTKPQTDAAAASRSPSRGHGPGGSRLAEAFDAVAKLPTLSLAREAVLRAARRSNTPPAEIAAAAERDPAIAFSLMRHANNGGGPTGRTASVTDAVNALGADGVLEVMAELPSYELFGISEGWSDLPDRYRLHASAVAEVTRRIARELHLADCGAIVAAALLHDCGELVLARMYPSYGELRRDRSQSPGERVRIERRELGIDHAVVGGVLLRRWGLPGAIATGVEQHHSAHGKGLAAQLALADLIVHHEAGDPVSEAEITSAAERSGLDRRQLSRLMFQFGQPVAGAERPPTEPSPLSARESDALRGLVEGKVYKEIAVELGLSVSTVRSHLHNVYKKLGAADRAQAVLMARDRGWV